MGQSPYHCVCYTCEQERVEEAVVPAVKYYEYHAEQDHTVEVIRLVDDSPVETSED